MKDALKKHPIKDPGKITKEIKKWLLDLIRLNKIELIKLESVPNLEDFHNPIIELSDIKSCSILTIKLEIKKWPNLGLKENEDIEYIWDEPKRGYPG